MAFCETNKRWTMTLTLDGDANPGHVETLAFDVMITNGVITGTVHVSAFGGPQMSELKGRCNPRVELSGVPLVSHMSFIFRVKKGATERGIHMAGIAYNPTGISTFNPFFSGTWRTFAPDANTPSSGGAGELQALELAADPGETGTGTGNQT